MNHNMSENEFQFYKEKLQKDVKEYMEIDDKIKALNKAVKNYRKNKDDLSKGILDTMKVFDLNYMNTKNGRLIYNETTTKKPLNKTSLLSGLTSFFNDDVEKAKMCSQFVMSKRETVKKVTLKRTINKKTMDII